MNIKTVSDEVFYAEGEIVTFSAADLAFLKQQTQRNPRKRARLCTHHDVSDPLHEMIIVNLRDTYVRPHKNTNKPKSFQMLEGMMDVVVFDDAGKVTGATRLGAYASGYPSYFRLHETRFHTLRTITPLGMFQETTRGPFVAGDTVFAAWAPEDQDIAACTRFLERMDADVATLRSLKSKC
ncbi:MAG: cupin fold metalloprotein, WbuC family [Verrucomicrobia bacterium]|nr:cupin fold metalloprotein, WbuC family [Verrucomicrobiota bacterium]